MSRWLKRDVDNFCTQESSTRNYPVLNCLRSAGVCHSDAGSPLTEASSLCSLSTASRLLDHFFSSPNQEWHTRLIRKRNLLSFTHPRPTSPALLCSILCMACYMPNPDKSPILPEMSNGQFVALRRGFLSRTLRMIQPALLGDVEPSLDDGFTSYFLTSIGPSEDETESNMAQWLLFMKLNAKKLNLNIDVVDANEEEKEERRRLWWAIYIIDRHAALSFNSRTQLTDLECSQLPRPCPDELWSTDVSLEDFKAQRLANNDMPGVTYTVNSIDMFGILLPISSILGDILEFHFIRQHPTFGSNPNLLMSVRGNIETNLLAWQQTLAGHLVRLGLTSGAPVHEPAEGFERKIVLYGRHLYHCMHVLLYGAMDLVQMYRDHEWQTSPDFLRAAEHANNCAEISGQILVADPRLHYMYRYFGTYFLQSSFIFLILAQKLGNAADDLIIKNCTINLQALEAFVQISNISYQRTFAGILRKTLLDRSQSSEPAQDLESTASKGMDEAILPYRWVAGSNGLWGITMKPS
ncbi:hypothetical protein BP6252_01199 [Coleophoma cylindrospora]|uniref:Xylanolytic transcriptional activator regulatory domain-containing protein n=1 Tax=Coleophoma cylindrospora TaxID=1849047 RepID=A0A3D8SS90_9HELO|nr:hypothetical protein BP6252_01199 [Coleophoma cylindrospora]